MKKTLLFFAFLLSALQLMAFDELILKMPPYQVVSDVKNVSVPVGRCKVKGQVSPTFDFKRIGMVLRGGIIATLDKSYETTTDSSGNFSFMIESTDTAIFFYKPDFEEIVIWKYNFQSQHIVTINFYPGYGIEAALKPVIYMYSENPLIAEIELSCKGDLTYSYPDYCDGWNVSVDRSGITDMNTGKTYPYLFWEGQVDIDFKTTNEELYGFVIDTDSCTSFLESKLAVLGLNDQETADFIAFWAPRMIKHEMLIVQFLVDDEYSSEIATLSVTPQPDALRRIYMIYRPISSVDPVITQSFHPSINFFERKGFTVVEWGGSEIKPSLIK